MATPDPRAPQATTARLHQHPEAFCLMEYRADDGTETEVIWNSRDGVTPFVVALPSGKAATHVNWSHDVRVWRTMADALGVRRFIDHTEETARAGAARYVDQFWEHPQYPMSSRYETKDAAIDAVVADWIGTPTIIDAEGATS